MNKKTHIPASVLMGKYYCHRCGERLKRHPVTRTVSPADEDYKKHRRLGRGFTFLGDVEITEYKLRCHACEMTVEPEEQQVTALIQKRLGRTVIEDGELEEMREKAERTVFGRRRLLSLLSGGAVLLLFFLFLLLMRVF